jgi:D-alanyl-D-alanine carboxypeptidase
MTVLLAMAACQVSPVSSPSQSASPSVAPASTPASSPTPATAACEDLFGPEDGRVAFALAIDGTPGIATINADGSDFRIIVDPDLLRQQPNGGSEAPRWTPDGRILFDSNLGSAAADANLFLVDATGGEPRQLTDSAGGIEYFASISADGALLAYGKGLATGDPANPHRHLGIHVSDATGQNERQLTMTPDGNLDEWVDFSPDGTQLAFNRQLGGEPGSARSSIYLINVDGTNLRQITDPELNAIRPRWSPDGRLIAFSSNSENFEVENANVWLVAPDGSGLRQLTHQTGLSQAFFPDFSPDGQHIVYINHTANSGTQDLAILALDGSATCILYSGTRSRLANDMDWGPSAPSSRAPADLVFAGTRPLPRPPPCDYADDPTAQDPTTAWASIILDTHTTLGPAFTPPDLVDTATTGLNSGHLVRAILIEDLRALAAAARAAGAPLAIQSAYRSYATQEATFAHWVAIGGYEQALLTSARPGHSEHQLGTGIDFTSAGNPAAPWISPDWAQTDAGAWMAGHAWQFGFVMSYPRDAQAATCYAYEPWHYRYVGHGVAAAIHAAGLAPRPWLWFRLHHPPKDPSGEG